MLLITLKVTTALFFNRLLIIQIFLEQSGTSGSRNGNLKGNAMAVGGIGKPASSKSLTHSLRQRGLLEGEETRKNFFARIERVFKHLL